MKKLLSYTEEGRSMFPERIAPTHKTASHNIKKNTITLIFLSESITDKKKTPHKEQAIQYSLGIQM